MPLWKQHSSESSPSTTVNHLPEPEAPRVGAEPPPRARTTPSPDHAVFTREVVIRGEICGTDPVFIDGLVEGSVTITNERVTVGPTGRVYAPAGQSGACLKGREVVVMGEVRGSIYAEERVEIRANGRVTGEISTIRVSIEDGALFQGGIDIRRPKEAPVVDAPEEQAHLAGAAV